MKICTFLFTSIVLAYSPYLFAQKTISGYVREGGSQEQLIGVTVFVPGTSFGTVTNTYGFYSLTVPIQDSLTLSYSFVGYEKQAHKIFLTKNKELNVFLTPVGRLLDEVTVRASAQKDKVSETAQMSQISIPIQQIQKIPAFLGEIGRAHV